MVTFFSSLKRTPFTAKYIEITRKRVKRVSVATRFPINILGKSRATNRPAKIFAGLFLFIISAILKVTKAVRAPIKACT